MISVSARVTLLMLLAFCLLASGAYYPCCQRYTRIKVPFSEIKGLSIQTDKEICHMNAIIFHTNRGKACFNPASNWVMDYVNRLRHKAQMVHMRTTHP